MKYGEITLGQVEAIINKLGGMKGVKLFLSGELVIKKIERKFKIWKKVKFDTNLKTITDFLCALRNDKFRITDFASTMIRGFNLTKNPKKIEINLIKVTVGELGLKKHTVYSYDEVYKKAKEFGLELCPPEVGPQLRLQYKDQPQGENILVAMNPISRFNDPSLFCLQHDDSKLWLSASWGGTGSWWSFDSQWIFCYK